LHNENDENIFEISHSEKMLLPQNTLEKIIESPTY